MKICVSKRYLIPFISLFFFFSCATAPPSGTISKNESNLTPGMITTTLKKGESTKAQVMQFFGPPDLITSENDVEMWGYDKISSESANSGFAVGIGGLGGGVIGGAGYKQGQSSSSTKTVFLLMYFKDDILIDYKLSVTKF